MDYHGRIMNVEVDVASMAAAGKPRSLRFAFKAGHRDARHAAAEIANEADAEIARITAAKDAEIARLREALRLVVAYDEMAIDCDSDVALMLAYAGALDACRAALAQVAEVGK